MRPPQHGACLLEPLSSNRVTFGEPDEKVRTRWVRAGDWGPGGASCRGFHTSGERWPGICAGFDLASIAELHVRTEDTFATACWLLGLTATKPFDGRAVSQIRCTDARQ